MENVEVFTKKEILKPQNLQKVLEILKNGDAVLFDSDSNQHYVMLQKGWYKDYLTWLNFGSSCESCTITGLKFILQTIFKSSKIFCLIDKSKYFNNYYFV